MVTMKLAAVIVISLKMKSASSCYLNNNTVQSLERLYLVAAKACFFGVSLSSKIRSIHWNAKLNAESGGVMKIAAVFLHFSCLDPTQKWILRVFCF